MQKVNLETLSVILHSLSHYFFKSNQLWCAESILEISNTTGIMVDPVYNIKAIRGKLHEMKNNPGRFKGHRILYIHTGK